MTDIPKEQHITLHGPGTIPGLPGHHGPGNYLVDYAERTIRSLPESDPAVEKVPARTAKPVQGIEQAQ